MLRRRLLTKNDDGILWLYKDGDECVNVTGGWVLPPVDESSSGTVSWAKIDRKRQCTTYARQKNSDHLYLAMTQSTNTSYLIGCQSFYTSNNIDVSAFTKLNVKLTVNKDEKASGLSYCLDPLVEGKDAWRNSSGTLCEYYGNFLDIPSSVTNKTTFNVDISGISGNLKIRIGNQEYEKKVNVYELRIYEIWLSKD